MSDRCGSCAAWAVLPESSAVGVCRLSTRDDWRLDTDSCRLWRPRAKAAVKRAVTRVTVIGTAVSMQALAQTGMVAASEPRADVGAVPELWIEAEEADSRPRHPEGDLEAIPGPARPQHQPTDALREL